MRRFSEINAEITAAYTDYMPSPKAWEAVKRGRPALVALIRADWSRSLYSHANMYPWQTHPKFKEYAAAYIYNHRRPTKSGKWEAVAVEIGVKPYPRAYLRIGSTFWRRPNDNFRQANTRRRNFINKSMKVI